LPEESEQAILICYEHYVANGGTFTPADARATNDSQVGHAALAAMEKSFNNF